MQVNEKIVTRSIAIQGSKVELFKWLEELPAVVHLQYNDQNLTVQYDAAQLQWSIVLQLLKRHEIYRQSWFNQLKTSWYSHKDNQIWQKANG